MKNLTLLFIASIALLASNLSAQSTLFTQSIGSIYDDNASSVITTPSNDVYLSGNAGKGCIIGSNMTTPNDTSKNTGGFIIKYDKQNNFQWKTTFGKTYNQHVVRYLQHDEYENIYASGQFRNEMHFERNNMADTLIDEEDGRLYISAYDSSGNFLSIIQLGGQGNTSIVDFKVLSPNSHLLLLSASDSLTLKDQSNTAHTFKATNSEIMILANTDSLGNFFWAETIEGSGFTGNIMVDHDTNIYVGANSFSDVTVQPSGANISFIKYQSTSILVKYSKTGKLDYAKELYDTYVECKTYFNMKHNQIYFVGEFYEWITFNIGTQNTIPIRSADQDFDIVFGTMNLEGVTQWANTCYSNGWDQALQIDSDSLGNVLVTGFYSDTLHFGNSERNDTSILCRGEVDAVLAKFSPQGEFIWAGSLSGTGVESKFDIVMGANDEIFAWTWFGSDTAYYSFGDNTIDTLYAVGPFDLAYFKIENSFNNAPMFELQGYDNVQEDFNVDTLTLAPILFEGEESEVIDFTVQSLDTILDFVFNKELNQLIIKSKENMYGTHNFYITAQDGKPENYFYTDTISIIISAVNDAPLLEDRTDTLTIDNQNTLTLDIANFTISDVDNAVPNDHSLIIDEGDNFSVNESTITPTPSFVGYITLQVSISDKVDTSNTIPLVVEVTETSTTEINAPSYSSHSLYPNPAKSHLWISNPAGDLIQINIFNSIGSNVLSVNQFDDETIDISSLISGVYQVRINNATESFVRTLLVK